MTQNPLVTVKQSITKGIWAKTEHIVYKSKNTEEQNYLFLSVFVFVPQCFSFCPSVFTTLSFNVFSTNPRQTKNHSY